MKRITAGTLDVAYLEAGPTDGPPVILLHGFPYDVHAYDVVVEHLAAAGRRCLVPYLRGYGPTRFCAAQTPRSGQQAALGADVLALLDALAIPKAVLAGYNWGGRAACIVAALWPERVRGLVSCGTGYNIQDLAKARAPIASEREHRYWYWYYFNSARGRAGLTENRSAVCRLLWQLFSPTWVFDDVTFARSAAAFDNPDFVDVVIHSYRHRIGEAPGDPALDATEWKLSLSPAITVPSIVLQGADDGVDPPETWDSAAAHFKGPYRRRVLPGVGHNLPQESPLEFVQAVLELS